MTNVLLAGACITALPATAAGDAVRGKRLYEQQCTACHTIEQSDVGPAHRGVYGRRVASLEGFEYSAALRAQAALVWTEATLDRWLTAPEKFAPGQAMGVSVPTAEARADLIAYLRSLKSAP